MAFAHAHENPVVADNTRMPYDEPVHLALDLGADDRHRFGIKGKQAAEILLFHFSRIQMFRFVLHSRSARAERGGENDP